MSLRYSIATTISFFCFISTAFATPMPKPSQTLTPIDQVVAIVNDDIITQQELSSAMDLSKKRLTRAHISLPSNTQLKSAVLDQLINKKIQLELAARNNITFSQSEINAHIAQIARSTNLSVAAWKQQFYRQGIKPKTLMNNVRDQLIIEKLQHEVLASKVQLTTDEMKQVNTELQTAQDQAIQYKLDDMIIPLPDQPSAHELRRAKKAALAVKQAAKANRSITGAQINELGWTKGSSLPDLFLSPLKHSAPGSVIGPIQAGNGFHIIKYYNKKIDHTNMPTKSQLIGIAMQKKFVKSLQTWLPEIKKNAFIKIIAS